MDKSKGYDWQKPFVDVFKRFGVFESSKAASKGQVIDMQDNSIGRRILKITGPVSASNYVSIPDPTTNTKSLGLTGKYIYLEFFVHQGKFFNIHLDFQVANRDPIVTITISNMFEIYKTTTGNVLQLPYPKNALSKWTVMVLDVEYFLTNFGLFPPTQLASIKGSHQLKAIKICSTINVRGIYTSDTIYDIKTLPKELSFKLPKDRNWSNSYQMVFYPQELDPDLKNEQQQQPPPEMENQENINDNQQLLQISQKNEPLLSSSINEMKKSAKKQRQSPQKDLSYQQYPQQQQQLQQQSQNIQPSSSELRPEHLVDSSQQNVQTSAFYRPQQSHDQQLVHHSKSSNFFKANTQRTNQGELDSLKPYPILKLNHTIGFSGKYCPDIKWSRLPEQPNELLYTSGSILIASDVNTQQQRFLLGHTAPIACLDVSRDGKWLATGQSGPKSIVKVWDYAEGDCLVSFQCPYEIMTCVSFSYNRKLLATVGVDKDGLELIIIWNIDEADQKKKPEMLAKQNSDFNIITLKFSPIKLDQLVSCGRENIRFWRIKNSHLPGCAVVLNHHARNTVFSVLDYEFSFEDPSAAQQFGSVKRVFVGSKQGMLYQVNYATRELEGVFKCHEQAICSICLSAGFCVTGSEDQYLRVWPLDFSEFLIEAKHEGILISLDISQDALSVACGTSTGGLGILDLTTHNYKTYLRSHTEEILAMELHTFSNHLITLSKDLTIRIWDIEKYEQVYEFTYPAEDLCTCISSFSKGMQFAAGFQSGVFRIFDIEKTCIIEEGKYHDCPITSIVYTPEGTKLIVADKNCFYSVYDVERKYQPAKTLEHELPSDYQSIAVAPNSQTIALIGDSGTHINFYDTTSLALIMKMFCPNTNIKKLMFSTNSVELFVLTAESKIKVFGINRDAENNCEAYLLREQACVHRDNLQSIAFSSNFLYLASVGGDNLLKIWDYEFSLQGPGSNQIFIGHINKINNVIFLPNNKKILTSGGFEGIYEWDFFGDTTKAERTLDFTGLQPAITKKPAPRGSNNTQQQKPLRKRKDQQPQQQQQQSSNNNNNVNSEDKIEQYFEERGQDQGEQQPNNNAEGAPSDFLQEEKLQSSHQKQLQQQMQLQQIFDQSEQPQQLFQQQQDEPEDAQRGKGGEEYEEEKRGQGVQDEEDNYYEEQGDNVEDLEENPPSNSKSKIRSQPPGYQQQQQQSQSLSQLSNKFVSSKIEVQFEPLVVDYKMQKRRKERKGVAIEYEPSATRTKLNLPYRQYYLETLSTKVEQKIQQIQDNTKAFSLDYIVGYNNDSHDNVVWNYYFGWFAYSVENLIIVEDLEKERKQRIITLPDFISVLTMSKDGKHLLAGAATRNDKDNANIYVLDITKDFKVLRTLSFHTRGVQALAFAENGKYLLSVGNFKECTVAVWEYSTGKLLASSYTLDKINDIKVCDHVFAHDRVFEFCTVGRDQLQFWAFTKQQKLEYYDIFLPKDEDGRIPEVSALDYYYQFQGAFNENKDDLERSSSQNSGNKKLQDAVQPKLGKTFVLAGLTNGHLIVVEYGSFQVVYKGQVAQREIVGVTCSSAANKVVLLSLDGCLYHWTPSQFQSSSQFYPNFSKIVFPSPPVAVSMELAMNEGIVGLQQGGIYYFDIAKSMKQILAGTLNQHAATQAYCLNDQILITCHSDCNTKVWNLQSGEQIFQYNWGSQITAICYDGKAGALCFLQNNNEIRGLNFNKMNYVDLFQESDYVDVERKSPDYPVAAFETVLAGRQAKFFVMKKGNVFTLEQLIKDKQTLLRANKIFELPNFGDIQTFADRSILVHSNTKGKIQVILVDYNSDRQNRPYGFTCIDEMDIFENPHGNLIDQAQEQRALTQFLYSDVVSSTKTAISKLNNGVYYAVNSMLQYLFVRNYQQRQLLQRINLIDFPTSISLFERKGELALVVGLQNGAIEKIDIENKDERRQHFGLLDGPILDVFCRRNRNKVLVVNPSGLSIFQANDDDTDI